MSEEEGMDAWESVLGVEDTYDQSSLDLVYSHLRSSRRRFVIEYLHQHDESTTLSELATQLAAQEIETGTERIPDKPLASCLPVRTVNDSSFSVSKYRFPSNRSCSLVMVGDFRFDRREAHAGLVGVYRVRSKLLPSWKRCPFREFGFDPAR